MSAKFYKIGFIVLVVVNIGWLAFLTLSKGGDCGPGRPCKGRFNMEERLHLNPETAKLFDSLRSKHFAIADPLRKEMGNLKVKSIQASTEDSAKFYAHAAAEKFEAVHLEMNRHFNELKSHLNAEQKAEMDKLIQDNFGGSPPFGPPHRGGRMRHQP